MSDSSGFIEVCDTEQPCGPCSVCCGPVVGWDPVWGGEEIL